MLFEFLGFVVEFATNTFNYNLLNDIINIGQWNAISENNSESLRCKKKT